MSDNDLLKLIFMDFLTNPQTYALGSANFFDFALFLCNEINRSENYFSYYDKMTDQIIITEEKANSDPVLKMQFLEENTFQLLTPDNQDEILQDSGLQVLMGKAAMLIMNATTAWETEELPKYLTEYPDDEQINLFLSKTNVSLTKKETEVITDILKRILEAESYHYDYCKNVAFELEVRAVYPHGAPKKPNEPEEDSDSDDFEWL